jgi:hypothetical protein
MKTTASCVQMVRGRVKREMQGILASTGEDLAPAHTPRLAQDNQRRVRPVIRDVDSRLLEIWMLTLRLLNADRTTLGRRRAGGVIRSFSSY